MADRAKRPPGEALVDLRRRLSLLPPRDPGRTDIVARAANAYGISTGTLYRALRELNRPKSVRRVDHGPRTLWGHGFTVRRKRLIYIVYFQKPSVL